MTEQPGATTADEPADESEEENHPPSPIAAAVLSNVEHLELFLVRHGQQVNVLERDSPLSEIGRRQAQEVGRYLADFEIDAVYSSQLSRAHDTGLAIASHHDLECIVDEDLREVELGLKLPEGKTSRDLLTEEELRDRAEEFAKTRKWETFAFSETGEQLRLRVMPVIDQIIGRHPTGQVVVACHGGVINAIVGSLLGVEEDFFFRAAHCSIHRIKATAERSVVNTLNESHHLVDEGLVTH